MTKIAKTSTKSDGIKLARACPCLRLTNLYFFAWCTSLRVEVLTTGILESFSGPCNLPSTVEGGLQWSGTQPGSKTGRMHWSANRWVFSSALTADPDRCPEREASKSDTKGSQNLLICKLSMFTQTHSQGSFCVWKRLYPSFVFCQFCAVLSIQSNQTSSFNLDSLSRL